MIEMRPESADPSAIRELVSDALTAAPGVVASDTGRPARSIRWPDARTDLTAHIATSASRATFVIDPKRTYRLEDFTCLHDEAFVNAAYRGLLERPPDALGLGHYLRILREGGSKTEVLGRLRYSDEGKRVAAIVPALRVRYPITVAMRLPVLGHVAGFVELVLHARAWKSSVKRLEAHVAQLAQQQSLHLEALEDSTHRNLSVLEARIDALRDR